MFFNRLIALLLCAVLVVLGGAGCATRPTVGRSDIGRSPNANLGLGTAIEPVQIQDDTVVIDARPLFQYSLGHIPRAITLQWDAFTEPEAAQKGVLQKDLFAIARRLANLGISPESKVVVVGSGLQGEAEEWRLAWMLRYLGVANSRAAPLSSFAKRLTLEVPAAVTVPLWKPVVVDGLRATRTELQGVVNKSGIHKPLPPPGKGESIKTYKLIDARSVDEYLGKAGLVTTSFVPNMDAVNIPWKEFFTVQGLPNREIVARLLEIGFTPDHRILVFSNKGVRSAAVTLALRELGYPDVANYDGGLLDLLSAYPR